MTLFRPALRPADKLPAGGFGVAVGQTDLIEYPDLALRVSGNFGLARDAVSHLTDQRAGWGDIEVTRPDQSQLRIVFEFPPTGLRAGLLAGAAETSYVMAPHLTREESWAGIALARSRAING